jgi:poly-beta-1,6-N-acetyl-D-glucosamine synthase
MSRESPHCTAHQRMETCQNHISAPIQKLQSFRTIELGNYRRLSFEDLVILSGLRRNSKMTAVEFFFWLSLAVLFYCYAGYGATLFIWNYLKSIFLTKQGVDNSDLPAVTLIVAAYNEENILGQKIKNTLELDYPSDLLNVIFVTDGSTDGSEELIAKHDFITHLHQNERKGKSAAIKRAMRFVQTSVVVFSDANSMLNSASIKAIVRHYVDEKVGGVAGEKKILNAGCQSAVGDAEGLYWKYESFMKKQDAAFHTVVGAAGELFSIRTELFHPLDDSIILDDFILSMHVCLEGYKIEYEPAAFAMEAPSSSLTEEEKRKVRIAAGAYQAVGYLVKCLNVFKYPLLTLQYFSRRLLRWIACPLLIAMIFACNISLVIDRQGIIYNYLLLAQALFYFLALAGRVFISLGWRIGILKIPFYFLFMNICLVKGFFNYIKGRQTVTWEKSLREAME